MRVLGRIILGILASIFFITAIVNVSMMTNLVMAFWQLVLAACCLQGYNSLKKK